MKSGSTTRTRNEIEKYLRRMQVGGEVSVKTLFNSKGITLSKNTIHHYLKQGKYPDGIYFSERYIGSATRPSFVLTRIRKTK